MILKTARIRKAIADAKSILHLPRFARILHRKSRRTIVVVSLGVLTMLVGSLIASNKDAISELVGLHHVVVDTIGYFIHGAGALPAFRYIEPLWLVLFGVAEEAAPLA